MELFKQAISLLLNKKLWLIVLISLVSYTLYYKFSNFILYASYANFQTWFPKWHVYIFTTVWLFKIASVILILWAIFKYGRAVILSLKLSTLSRYNNARAYIATTNSSPSPRSIRLFVGLHMLLLVLAVAGYYMLPVHSSQFMLWQLYLSRGYLICLAFLTASFILPGTLHWRNKISLFLFTPSSVFNLGMYRILFFFLLSQAYLGNMHSSAFIEAKQRAALPLIGWLIDIMPISQSLYFYMCIAGLITCLFLMLGLFTRFFLVLNAVLVFYIVAVPNFYGKMWHAQLPIWISWFLLFAPVNGRFALDNYLFPKTKREDLSPNHTFPIRIIWLQIGMIYFWAGFHKLWQSGFTWALGPSMINQVRIEWFESYDIYPALRIDNYPTLLHVGGIAVIAFELLFVFMLLSKHWKYISIIGGLAMHNLLQVFMYIGFVQLQYQYIVFINFEKAYFNIRKWQGKMPINKPAPTTTSPINKKMVYLSLAIFVANALFGLTNTSSYPFSVYPTYTEIVEGEKEYVHFEVIDADKKWMDVRQLGKRYNFRWESFSRLDYAIAEKYKHTHKVDTQAINNHWVWWASAVDTLKSVDTLDAYIVRRSINPDSANIVIDKKFLLRIYPNLH